ncbi:hypothetical protein [Reichenbachiella sp. MALMAid0571]|uniref:hypothetical protein n=1 Tax=Reichenbachiella sp. MALMAid0571 TaxID=3143939 RepID=UPI0032DEC6D4
MDRRNFVKTISAVTATAIIPNQTFGKSQASVLDLSSIRKDMLKHCEAILDKNGPYGSYRSGLGKRPDLYSSCDVAIMRTIMGEDLMITLTHEQRKQWIDHINSFANHFHGKPTDGSYGDIFGHSVHHANGMVIGALGVLGGKQKYPVKLYEEFSSVDKIFPWLEKIDWVNQWTASHLFWGGMHCYSMSAKCSDLWKETVFNWLNNNIDEQSGWWKKGVPHADRHQPLGGSVHILPLYQHLNREFPVPEKVIDSVLDLQLSNGLWLLKPNLINVMTYLELDALYALKYMSTLVPNYRADEILQAVNRHADCVISYLKLNSKNLLTLHPHRTLSAIGALGLLQQFYPNRFVDDVQWTDIFSDVRFYQTSKVEVFQ